MKQKQRKSPGPIPLSQAIAEAVDDGFVAKNPDGTFSVTEAGRRAMWNKKPDADADRNS
jgi:hypothetical protein